MKCPGCGQENPGGARFCNGCGNRLDGAAAKASPQAYTPQHLAEKIQTSGVALVGERKQVTVLFASSGSRSARSSIEPLRSAKSTVTCLRSPTRATPDVWIFSARCWGVYACGEALAAAPSSRFPHPLQKRAPPGFSCPHPGH